MVYDYNNAHTNTHSRAPSVSREDRLSKLDAEMKKLKL